MNAIVANTLHKKFVQLGMMRHKLMNEMLAILPEIYESEIYKKYASSILEYASKFGGISESAVTKRLRLEKYLVDKPALREMIREVGVNKVSLIATIATKETEKAFADKVRYMSKSAISTLSQELRMKGETQAGQVGLFEESSRNFGGQLRFSENRFQDFRGDSGPSTCAAVPIKIKIELDEEQSFLFLKLREKWGKHLSHKEVMKKILEKMVEEEFAEKQPETKVQKPVTGDGLAARDDKTMTDHTNRKFGVTCDDSSGRATEAPAMAVANISHERIHDVRFESKPAKRYIPAARKRQILQESHGRCSYPGCNRPAQIFHHTNRFMESKNHDSIQTLCRDHHEFPHNGVINQEGAKPTEWKIDIQGKIKHPADILYRRYKTTLARSNA